MKKLKYLTLGLLILLKFSLFVIAEDKIGEGNEDLGEGMASFTIILLGFGVLYVLLRRSFVLSKYLSPEYDHIKERMLTAYRRFRKPLLYLHSIVLFASTITAGIHGFLFLEGESEAVVSGSIAFAFMVLLSLSGIFIHYKFRPVWEYRKAKTAIRFVHRQWLFSILVIIALIFHLAD